LSLLDRLFAKSRRRRSIEALYGSIVAQARYPWFYAEAGVPDTVEGRFELIALHAWLVMRRLKDTSPAANDFNQALFDHMFADMDYALRELGAGDLGVGDKVKELARHFYGRVAAYEGALLPDADPGELERALDRNLFGSTLPDAARIAAVAAYVRAEAMAMRHQSEESLMAGQVVFGPPSAVPVTGAA